MSKNRESAKACAERLNITERELKALMDTRNDLATEKLKYISNDEFYDDRTLKFRGRRFNMGVAAQRKDCGTACCIGGSMALRMRMSVRDADSYVGDYSVPSWASPKGLQALFFPPQHIDYDRITPAQAVKAIDNFIETGDPKWNAVLK